MPSVLSIGNPLLDIHAECGADTVTTLGFEPWGVHHAGDETSELLHALLGPGDIKAAGGAFTAANTAASLGVQTGFIGAAGVDDKSHKTSCHESGLQDHILIKPGRKTGTCWYLHHPEGKKTIITCPGAALALTGEDITSVLSSAGVSCTHIYVEGFLLPREDIYLALMEALKLSSRVPIIDPGSERIAELFSGRVDHIMTDALKRGFTPVLISTSNELSALSGLPWKKALRRYSETGWEMVVKLGAAGCAVSSPGMSRTIMCPPDEVFPGNPVGAGDIFAGAYITSRFSGNSPEESAGYANRIAGRLIR